MLGNAEPERTTNFGLPAVQHVRDLCVYFLSSSFVLLPIFSSFSNNATRHDLPNRQSINQSINIEPSGNMGFTTISLSSNVNNSLGFAIQRFMQ